MDVFAEKEKLYYSIGEIKDLTGVEPHVLRYWESEFPSFKPRKNRTGQRAYTKKDIEIILEIKKLLYEEKFTIKGAKNKLKTLSLKKKENKSSLQEEDSKKTQQSQMFFGEIEQNLQATRSEKDFLNELRKKLIQLSSML